MLGMLLGGMVFFAAMPSTSTYKLNSYGFSSGSGSGTSTNYQLNGQAGSTSSRQLTSTNYKIDTAFAGTRQANVPTMSAVDNNSGQYYNKLHFVINTQGNPSDAKYALQISTDNFAADTRYIKNDFTIGTTLTNADFMTYTSWGGASGSTVIGLSPGVTYYIRASATTGNFTQTPYGPSANATTALPSITLNVTTQNQASPPFSVDFGTLTAGTVGTTANYISAGIDSNAASGADIYIRSKNAGLTSTTFSTSISSATADLTAVSSGYGAQSSFVGQTSGGPLAAVAPYDGTSNSVGIVDGAARSIYTSTTPITGGIGRFFMKAKAASTQVAATDYNDTVTILAAGNF